MKIFMSFIIAMTSLQAFAETHGETSMEQQIASARKIDLNTFNAADAIMARAALRDIAERNGVNLSEE